MKKTPLHFRVNNDAGYLNALSLKNSHVQVFARFVRGIKVSTQFCDPSSFVTAVV